MLDSRATMPISFGFARTFGIATGVCCLAVAVSGQQARTTTASAKDVTAPVYKVDPFWPKMPLRNKWLLQGIPTGMSVVGFGDADWRL